MKRIGLIILATMFFLTLGVSLSIAATASASASASSDGGAAIAMASAESSNDWSAKAETSVANTGNKCVKNKNIEIIEGNAPGHAKAYGLTKCNDQ